MLKKLSTLKSKAFASLTAFALAVLVPAAAFAAESALETGAKSKIEEIATMVGNIGLAVLAISAAIIGVTYVMRMMKKA